MTKELKNKNLGLCNLEKAQENLNNIINIKTMENKKSNSQETVGALMTGAQKVNRTECYSSISIISYDGDPIYHSYGKTDETMRQVGAAIMQFFNLGFQVEKEDDGFWRATNDKKDYCYIQVESLEWNGIENEIDGMCESIRDYFKV